MIKRSVLAELLLDLAELHRWDGESVRVADGKFLSSRAMAAHATPAPSAGHWVLADSGILACEACQFDFQVTYGDVGKGFIEVHHVLPLHASGPVVTRLEDLALVCSNCHRMIHRARPWLTPSSCERDLRQSNANRALERPIEGRETRSAVSGIQVPGL